MYFNKSFGLWVYGLVYVGEIIVKKAGENSRSHEPAKVTKAMRSCWKGVDVVLA